VAIAETDLPVRDSRHQDDVSCAERVSCER
jgi:hypothetical protein